MSDDIRLNSKRSIVLFIGSVALCLLMFVCGLWVGRFSFGGQAPMDRGSDSPVGSVGGSTPMKPTESPVPALPPTDTPSPPTSETVGSYVQAATFTSPADADTFVASLQVRGFTGVFARQTRLPSGDLVVQVLLGPYTEIEEARRVVSELRQQGVSDVQIVPAR